MIMMRMFQSIPPQTISNKTEKCQQIMNTKISEKNKCKTDMAGTYNIALVWLQMKHSVDLFTLLYSDIVIHIKHGLLPVSIMSIWIYYAQ